MNLFFFVRVNSIIFLYYLSYIFFNMTDDHDPSYLRKLEKLQKIISYSFEKIEHLFFALLTTSYLNDWQIRQRSFHESYSTLGDSVLHVICNEKAIKDGEYTKEGLTYYKQKYASNLRLHEVALSFNLQDFVRWGKSELNPPVWIRSDKILANYLEALLGAVYLDGGMESAKQVAKKLNILD